MLPNNAEYRKSLELLRETFPGRAYLTFGETAQALNVSSKTVARMARRVKDLIPAHKVAGCSRVPVTGLAEWAARRGLIGG